LINEFQLYSIDEASIHLQDCSYKQSQHLVNEAIWCGWAKHLNSSVFSSQRNNRNWQLHIDKGSNFLVDSPMMEKLWGL